MKKLTRRGMLALVIGSFAMAISALMYSVVYSDSFYLGWFIVNAVAGWSFLAKCLTEWLESEPIWNR